MTVTARPSVRGRLAVAGAALLVLGLLGAGCDSDRRAISRDDLPAIPDEPTHVVVLDDDGFDTGALEVSTRDLVRIEVAGDAERGVRADTRIDTGLLLPGEWTEIVFDEPGTYDLTDLADDAHVLVVTATAPTVDG